MFFSLIYADDFYHSSICKFKYVILLIKQPRYVNVGGLSMQEIGAEMSNRRQLGCMEALVF